MKRKFKLIVPSFLTLIFCLLLIAGSTFAIFSSTDDASIEVTSGKVKMTADLTDLLAYSVEATDGTGNAGSAEAFGVTSNYNYVPAEEVVAHQSYRFANGGLVNFNEEKTLILSNVTPGDRITLKLTLTNDSNVDIKYRVRLNATEDNGLLEGLTFSMQEGTNNAEVFVGVIKVGNWTLWSAPANPAAKVKEINLELVLPVNAGNEYQEKTAKLRFTVEAVQANAKVDTLLEEVNAHLALSNHNTMNDARADAETYRPAFDATKYLWNIDTDQFYDPSNVVVGFENRFFKAYTESTMPAVAEQKYNIYATGAWTNPVNVVVGFDAGDATGISSITYDRHDAAKGQEVVIRTNSMDTNLTVNAPLDVVHHYGPAGYLKIEAVANSSYHENGTVAFLEIKTGRVALEETSVVEQIHLSTTDVVEDNVVVDKVFDNIIISKAEEVKMPELSRDPVTIPEKGKLVVELQDSTNEETANSDFIWLTAVGIFEQVAISDNAETAKSTDNTTTYATSLNVNNDNEKEAEQKVAAQQIANNILAEVSSEEYTLKATTSDNGVTWNYTLESDSVENITQNVTVTVDEDTATVSVAGEAKTTTTQNGLDDTEKAAAQTEAKDKFAVATIGSTKYYSLKEALEAVQIGETLTVIKDCSLESRALVYSPTISNFNFNFVINAKVTFIGEGQIIFDVTSNSCRVYLSGSGTLFTEDDNLIMIKSGCGILNQQENEVIEVTDITVTGGKFSDCKIKFNGGHFNTLITGIVNNKTPGWSIINGGTFATKPEGVNIKTGYTLEQNPTTNFWELAVDIPANAIFKLIPEDNPDNVDYISESQLNAETGKLVNAYKHSSYTLELLKDYEMDLSYISPSNFWGYKFGIGDSETGNVIIDLKGYTLTFKNSNYGGSYFIAYDCASLKIQNGTLSATNGSNNALFYSWGSSGVVLENVTLDRVINNRNW